MKQKLLLATGLLALMMNGCKPEDNGPVGGKGGNASLHVRTAHHTRTISDLTVYIKYNAQSKPSDFDDSAKIISTPTDTFATFTGLKTGKYYLYGRGYDHLLSDSLVVGGVPITINEEKLFDVSCPVSEADGH
jgi:hypothetical protein